MIVITAAGLRAEIDLAAGSAIDTTWLNLHQLQELALWSAGDLLDYNERAAVLEFDAGLTREQANQYALHEVWRRVGHAAQMGRRD